MQDCRFFSTLRDPAPSLFLLLLLLLTSVSATAQPPSSWQSVSRSGSTETIEYPALDLTRLALEDEFDEALGKPPRFAVARSLSRSPVRDGAWVDLPNGESFWRVDVDAAEAVSLNFGFQDVFLPEGARLYIYSRAAEDAKTLDRFEVLGPYGPEINENHREFWTPILAASEATIELNVPTRFRDRVSLELVQVSQGYRAFGSAALGYRQSDTVVGPGKTAACTGDDDGKGAGPGGRSGSCNMDVACLAPDDPWNDPRRSVGAYTVGGTDTCTGSLVNNTANDRRMLFMTASHCGVNAGNAASVVVFWNYEWPTCRTPGDPSGTQVNPPDPSQSSSGASFVAGTPNPFSGATCSTASECSDVALLEMDDPADPAFDLFWSGWDRRTTSDATTCGPQGAAGSTDGLCASIHHPGVDEKRITFVEQDFFVDNIANAQGVHWRARWHTDPPVVGGIPAPQPASIPPGVTEPGSSGSPLYTADQRFLGVLSGGPAFCGATGTSLSDLYGQLAHAWEGLGTPATRMRDHLDPLDSGVEFIDGIGVSPFGLASSPSLIAACATDGSVDITLDVSADPDFSDPVTLSASGEPAGATIAFDVNPVLPPGSSTLTVGALGSAAPGAYTLDIDGAAAGQDTQSLAIPFELSDVVPPTAALTAPADGGMNTSLSPIFEWSASTQAAGYLIEVATDAGFGNVVISETVTGTSFQPASPLPSSTQFFWRVTPSNACGTASPSGVFSFTTQPEPGDCPIGTAAQQQFSDDMESGPNGWTLGAGSVQNTWTQITTDSVSGTTSWNADNVDTQSDQRLVSPEIILPGSAELPLTLRFQNRQEIEADAADGACWDAAVLEITTDGGTNWTELSDPRVLFREHDGIVNNFDGGPNPLAGSPAWCGDPRDWEDYVIDLSDFAGETVQLRFRLGTDGSVGDRDGWLIDDVRVESCVIVEEEIFADGFESAPQPPL